MVAFLCLFFPAALACLIWERADSTASKSFKDRILRYASFTVVINFVIFLAVDLIVKNPGNIVRNIQDYSDFAFKYLGSALLLSVVLPYGIVYLRNHVKVKFLKTKVELNIPWRLLASFYGVILIGLHVIRIFDNNFWGDEAFSIRLAGKTFSEMFALTAADVHPPFYYMVLIVAYKLFGNHGWVYHMVSVIPLVILTVFALTILWKRFGKEACFIFLTLIGLSNAAVVNNIETRMYSFAFMFVLFSFYGLYKMLNKEKAGLPLFIIFSLGAAYTHYYAMMSVAVFYGILLIFTIRKQFEVKKLIISYVCTIVGYCPWLKQMVTTFKGTSEGFWMTSFPGYEEGIMYFYQSDKEWYSYGLFALTLLIVLFLIIRDMGIVSVTKKEKYEVTVKRSANKLQTKTKWMICGVVAALATLVAGEMISTFIRPAFSLKYLFPVVSAMWMVLCAGISEIKYKKVLSLIIVVVSLVVFLPNYAAVYSAEKKANKKCTETQEKMQSLIEDDGVLMTNSVGLNWTILDYYMPNNPHKLISNNYTDFEAGQDYWLVWANGLSEDDYSWLESQGYNVEELIRDGMLGDNPVFLYRITAEN